MLNAGGVLGLVHMEIAVLVLPGLQKGRLGAEDLQPVDHLVVVVHKAVFQQQGPVGVKQLEKRLALLQLPDFLVGQHGVFTVGDAGACLFQLGVGGKAPVAGPPGLPHQASGVGLLGKELKGLPAGGLLKLPDDAGAHAVDGAELQSGGVVLPKGPGEPAAQVGGGCHRVGHSEDLLGRHLPAVQQITHPGQKGGGLSAAGHGQQQHRTFGLADGRLLLAVQFEGEAGLVLVKGHHLCRYSRLLSRANTRSENCPTSVLSSTSR